MTVFKTAVTVCVLIGLVTATAQSVVIDTVRVANPGNAADTRYATPGYGSVGYIYNIGKYEVTAGQYCEFLNRMAATDTYGLYDTNMVSGIYGCKIERHGVSGGYTYSVAADYANRPVNYVSWGDAARFVNWLHNGQPTGAQNLTTTEDGAYYLNGAMLDAQLLAVVRKPGWRWAITSEDEWYKAAYHKNDGATGNYFDYPTGTDAATSNDLIDPDPGNNATFYDDGDTVGGPYWRTEVGAHENSESPYGTYDQGGNLREWNEAVISGSYRGIRGGSYRGGSVDDLQAANRFYSNPWSGSPIFGFRVSEVPEPSSAFPLVLVLAVWTTAWRPRRIWA